VPRRVCGAQIDASRLVAHACCSPTTTTMVSSLLVEALSSPTDVLLSFYDTCDHEAINEFPNAVAKHFSDIFRTDDALLEVRIYIHLKMLIQRVATIDTSSHPLTFPLFVPRSRPCPLPRIGPRHFSIPGDVFVQIKRREMWRLGHLRFFPRRRG
jgi:hypothetical protein